LTTTVSSGTVSLLTCQSNRFIDNSTNAYAITPNGTPSVQRFNPFLPTYSQAYSTSVYGGSGYFNGSTDYLAFTASSATNCTGDFTLEGWVYLPSITVTGGGNPRIVTFGGTVGLNIVNEQTNNNYRIDVGASTIITSANNVAVLNTWQHFAVVRSGSTMTLYVNGVSKGTATYSSTITNSGSSYIGSYNTTSSFSAGYLSEIRFVVGTAVYTSAFTPPTAPLTAITNTQLLMSYQNGAIYDNAMMNDLITVGSAQISTSVVKYGTGSISFNGTNSYLKQGNTPQLQDYQLGSGDFTIEAWIYKTANGSAGYDALSQLGTNGNATDGWFFEISSSRGYVFSTNSTSIISYNSNPNTSAWQHVAVSKSGNNTKMFVNGSQVGSTYTSAYTIPNTATQATIGVDGSLALFFNGYVDDFRITKGYARYTTTFTPPTTALPNYGS
jgi:hypothetical protein